MHTQIYCCKTGIASHHITHLTLRRRLHLAVPVDPSARAFGLGTESGNPSSAEGAGPRVCPRWPDSRRGPSTGLHPRRPLCAAVRRRRPDLCCRALREPRKERGGQRRVKAFSLEVLVVFCPAVLKKVCKILIFCTWIHQEIESKAKLLFCRALLHALLGYVRYRIFDLSVVAWVPTHQGRPSNKSQLAGKGKSCTRGPV